MGACVVIGGLERVGRSAGAATVRTVRPRVRPALGREVVPLPDPAGGDPDIRDLLGMRSLAARRWVAVYGLCFIVFVAYSAEGLRAVWPMGIAVVVCVVGGRLLVASAGDPMRLPEALPVAFAGAAASAAVTSVVPAPPTANVQTAVLGMATVLLTFLCVRGRTALAWAGMAAMIAVWVAWGAWSGVGAGYGLGMSFLNIGPLIMSTFFAYTIRPLGNSIFVLRAQSTARAADAAASAAVLAARDAELDELDVLARPLLERIATGAALSQAERDACAHLEARLRDARRAPALRHAAVVDAAQRARERGVHVVMLDDGGTAGAEAPVLERLLSGVAATLDDARSGSVTVRVLPPGRRVLASILVEESRAGSPAPGVDPVHRIDFDHDGNLEDTDRG